MDDSYIYEIDDLESLEVLKETEEILAVIFRDYLSTSQEKRTILLREKQEEIELEEEKRRKYYRFGVRIFVTLNTILYDEELEAAYRQMLAVQEAGADAIIVQDLAILAMAEKGIGDIKGEIRIPLHASTQCAIRTPEQARFLESLGFSRLILESEL